MTSRRIPHGAVYSASKNYLLGKVLVHRCLREETKLPRHCVHANVDLKTYFRSYRLSGWTGDGRIRPRIRAVAESAELAKTPVRWIHAEYRSTQYHVIILQFWIGPHTHINKFLLFFHNTVAMTWNTNVYEPCRMAATWTEVSGLLVVIFAFIRIQKVFHIIGNTQRL